MKSMATLLTLALLTTVCSATLAGEKDSQRIPERQRDAESQRNTKNTQAKERRQRQVTHFYAGKLMLMNQTAIKMSEVAQERSGSQDVREFAKMCANSPR